MSKLIGSTWNKWDLHFHTPSSYDYLNPSVSNKDIVDGLISQELKVVAITDHHYIDVRRIAELRKLASNRLIILPGIELRSELGDKPIHYIGIFSESDDLDHIWDTIRGSLGLTPEGIRDKGGDDRIYVPISKAHKVISNLGGLISIHAGVKSNSLEGIENKEQFQQRIKYDVAKKYIDIFEIGQLKDVASYVNIVFPATNLERPLVIGSDNHDINKYTMQTWCWLKADLTFIGLRQVLNEPFDRVYLGECPSLFQHIQNNKTRYIDSLKFTKRTDSSLEEKWFSSVSLHFNPGLIAIIGNKGNGKSALADVLGLMGNCPHQSSFSFLQEDQFRHPKDNKGQSFDATLVWKSGIPIRKNLNDRFDSSQIESIRYIPQFHLDAICDELKGGKEGKFNEELKQVIFSRVPFERRLGKAALDELIDFRIAESNDKVKILLDEIKRISAKVVELEEKATEDYQNNLKAELKALQEEITAHESTKPDEIQKPDSDPKRKKEIEEISAKITELSKETTELDVKIEVNTKNRKAVNVKLELASKLRKKIINFEEQFESLSKDISKACKELGLSANELLHLSVDLSALDGLEETLQSSKTQLDHEIDEGDPENLVSQKQRITQKIIDLRDKLDLPNKEYQTYLENKESWEKKEKSLIGDADTPGTLKYFKKRLAELKKIPENLEAARNQQISYSKKIFQEKINQLIVYEELYAPVQKFIDTHPLAKDRFGLEFNVALIPKNFVTRFLDFINQGRKGSFHGEDEGRKVLEKMVNSASFDSDENLTEFLDDMLDHLLFDNRNDERQSRLIREQLIQGVDPSNVYQYIYGLNYLEPRYVLRWEGKPLERLSPGERGTLLLIFYLLVDDSRIPLVIDQPEGNLDNQTVYELLVDCVKEAKRNRQIFIVTHNPNLAVVCDAEQVIHAQLDKENEHQLVYTSGSLENPVICQKIVDVLEGTKPAIDNRVAKYKIIFSE